MGFDKLTAVLGARPVLAHSYAAFERCADIAGITIVCAVGREDEFRALLTEQSTTKLTAIVAGGSARHLSVWEGLRTVPEDSDLVAVHDAARPWIQPEQISNVLTAAILTGAATSARPITDTVKRADSDGVVIGSVERDGLWAMETPQIFNTSLLVSAYERILAEDLPVTDEVSAVEHSGAAVKLIANDQENPKVTFPADLQRPAPTG